MDDMRHELKLILIFKRSLATCTLARGRPLIRLLFIIIFSRYQLSELKDYKVLKFTCLTVSKLDLNHCLTPILTLGRASLNRLMIF